MARKKKDLFADVPQNVKDLVTELAGNYTPEKPKSNQFNQSPYTMTYDKLQERKALDQKIKEEKELYKKEPTVKISRAELEQMKASEEKARQKRLEVITVHDTPQFNIEDTTPFEEKLNKLVPKIKKDGIWDFGIEDQIPFFDIALSYELSGYKPINETEGLDFDPEWFIQTRRHFEKTGKFTNAPKGSKDYDDFWLQEYDRLNNGLEVKGYKVTGDHYFFLNFYRLMNTNNIQYAGQGRNKGFADFYVGQYEYFHYIDICKKTFKNCVALKGRGLGWSEIAASIISNTFERAPESRSTVVAYSDFYLDKTLNKVWDQINFCNESTDGGLVKPLLIDQPRKKKSGVEEKTTRIEKGWLSEVEGIIADKPRKVRGDRIDVLFFEEFGSFPKSLESFITGDALVHVNGVKIGIKVGFGTGGDEGPALSGLKKIFYDPITYDVLPMRHKYSKNGDVALTGFFIPSYRIVTKDKETQKPLMDNRGYTKISEGIEYYNRMRNKLINDPQGYLMYCAEYCFCPEDALVMEGQNDFNRVLLVEQLAQIKQFRRGPKPERGLLEYDFRGQVHSEDNIVGFKWLPSNSSKLKIIEKPLRDESGKAYRNLYVAGIDSIDMGKAETSDETRDPSEFCIVIKRRQHGLKPPAYVAIYKDRPNNINDAYRIALKLCEWYNCQALLENSKINYRQFLESKNKAGKYLMRRPKATMDGTNMGGSRQFGAPATEKVITHQLLLIAQYIEEYSQEIWFEDILEELLNYSYENKRKFDIIAALGMCELADEELQGFIARPVDEVSSSWKDFGYYIDENGYKRYGVKPTNTNINVGTLEFNNVYERPRTSDPRAY